MLKISWCGTHHCLLPFVCVCLCPPQVTQPGYFTSGASRERSLETFHGSLAPCCSIICNKEYSSQSLFPFISASRLYCLKRYPKNPEGGIANIPDFNIFQGSMPPGPPRLLRLPHFQILTPSNKILYPPQPLTISWPLSLCIYC